MYCLLCVDETVIDTGPIEKDKEHVRADPFTLPDKFYWDNVSLSDDTQVSLHTL